MSANTAALSAGRLWAGRARQAAARVEAWPVPRVLGALVLVEWLAVLALALTVRHAGWLYYQGGDQLWYYTLGWLLGHGQLSQTEVGYGWSVVLAPLSRIAGPNLVSALPAIVLLNVLVLLPAAMLALYGIAVRIGGRLFGYWTLVVWIVVPFIGIAYTNVGYHQRYTELTLPQSFGLTGMSDFPTTVAALVAAYFVARVVFDARPQLVDAVAGGVAAGAAIAVKPSTALFLVGPALAFAYRRRLVSAAAFVAGALPALLALAVWKERGLGHLPIVGAPGGRPLADGAQLASGAPLAGLDLSKYFHNLSWDVFLRNLDLLREHFWSGRLLEWLVIAGLIALGRRSRTGLLLLGGSFAAYVVVKASYPRASIEDSSLFRIMMPAFPAFVVFLASLPFLLPRLARRLPEWRAADARPVATRTQWVLVSAAIAVSGVAPLAAFAAADTHGRLDPANVGTTGMPIPANIDLGLDATVRGRTVTLRWRRQEPAGGPVFFRVWRARHDAFRCTVPQGGKLCNVSLPEVGIARRAEFRDRPGAGRWVYRVAIAANWLNDPGYGDPYLVSRPLVVTVR
jgi:hypothetical protein